MGAPKGTNSMAKSELVFRKDLVGTGWAAYIAAHDVT